jgi:hypothetical protein
MRSGGGLDWFFANEDDDDRDRLPDRDDQESRDSIF